MEGLDFKTDLDNALKVLKEGGVILYPTDTIWGLGCDASNEEAVKKIYALKNREDSKSMLVLVDNEAALERTVRDIPETVYQLIDVADEPLTIIYDNPIGVAQNLKATDGSLGVRITNEKFSKELCKKFRKPIVSTSANKSGTKAPANFSEISDEIKNSVDYVVKYRQEDNSRVSPSHIIKLSNNGIIKIIR